MNDLNLIISEFDGNSILDWEVTLDIKGGKKIYFSRRSKL